MSSILIRISPKHEVGNSQPAWHFICSITKLNSYLFRKILIKYQKPQLLFFIWAPKSKSKQMTLWGHRWWEKKYMLHFKLRSIFFCPLITKKRFAKTVFISKWCCKHIWQHETPPKCVLHSTMFILKSFFSRGSDGNFFHAEALSPIMHQNAFGSSPFHNTQNRYVSN